MSLEADPPPVRRKSSLAEYLKRKGKGSFIKSPAEQPMSPKTPKDRLLEAAGQAAAAKIEYQELYEAQEGVREWPDVGRGTRAWVRKILIENGVLDRVVIVAILGNSIALALEDPSPGAENPKVLEVLDLVFFIFYAFELAVKLTALGFFGHPKSYYGYRKLVIKSKKRHQPQQPNANPRPDTTIKVSYWALLDTIVVISGFLSLVLPLFIGSSSSTGPLSALRTFRLLRPLRAVSVLTDMRVLMKSILQSLPRLLDMLLLFLLFLATFGTIAVQLWKGALRNRCFPNSDLFGPDAVLHHVDIPETELGRVCSNATEEVRGYHCSWGATCVSGSDNAGNRGKSHFDNLGASVLTLTVSVTKEGWTQVMYDVVDGTNQFSAVYFVVLTFLGAFCIINLTIVIVNNVFDYNVAYEEAKRRLALEAAQTKLPPRSNSVFYPLVGPGEKVEENNTVEAIQWPDSKDVTALSRTQRRLINIVTSRIYETILFLVILGNVICLSLWHHGMSDTLLDTLLMLNLLFAACFVFDVVLKMCIFSISSYMRVYWNLFDFTIALISIVHVSFENPFYHSGSGSVKVIQVIRSLQVMRVLKLIVQFKRLKRWARVFMESLRSAFTLTALLALIVFIYALVGMQLFAGRFCESDFPDASPISSIPSWSYYARSSVDSANNASVCTERVNFDNVFTASLSLFQILSGEDWQLVMYNGMAAQGDFSSLYFLSWYFIGNSLLLNLFVSILISRVTSIKEEDLMIRQVAVEWKAERQTERSSEKSHRQSMIAIVRDRTTSVYGLAAAATDNLFDNERIMKMKFILQRIVSSNAMEGIIILAIILSCIILVMETPLLAPDTELARFIRTVDIVNTSVFCTEVFLKSLAFGFILGPDTYLRRDSWNQLDFGIAIASFLSVVFSSQLENLKILRSIRVLRPLRFINKFSGLKLVLGSMWLALPALGMVMVLGALGWLVFAILGVQLFSGSFYACTNMEWADVTLKYPNKTSCLAVRDPVTGLPMWSSAEANFDNILNAFLTLFEIASLEGWVDIMHLGMDSVSHTEAPRKNARPAVALYFVWFILLGAYFVVNLFISALVDAFQEQRRREDDTKLTFLTDDQKGWIAIQQALTRHVRTPIQRVGLSGGRMFCTRIVTSRPFDLFIYWCIVVNVVILGAEHYGQPEWWENTSEACNYFLVGVFTVEAGIKIKAYTAKAYFRSRLNKFDFFICATSWVGIIISFTSSSSIGGVTSVFRALRLLRLLRLVHAAKGVQSLIQTLFLTVPTIVNVMSVMLLIFFCYAVLGVFLFGRVEEGPTLQGRATFHDFPSALLLLLRIATGEAWPGLMHDAAVRPPFCSEHIDGCGSIVFSYMYFTSFVIIETYVILNVFIAVLLDSFDDVVANDVVDQHLSTHDLEHFFKTWQAYDPLQGCLIPVEELPNFLRDLGPPLGASGHEETTYQIVRRFLAPMRDAEIVDGMISQEGLLTHLSLLLYERTTGSTLDERMKKDMAARLAVNYQQMQTTKNEGEHTLMKEEGIVLGQMAVMVQAVWRGKLARVRAKLAQKSGNMIDEEKRVPSPMGSRSVSFSSLNSSTPPEAADEDYMLFQPWERRVANPLRRAPRSLNSFRFPFRQSTLGRFSDTYSPLTPPRRRPHHVANISDTTSSTDRGYVDLFEDATVVKVAPPSKAVPRPILTEEELNELL